MALWGLLRVSLRHCMGTAKSPVWAFEGLLGHNERESDMTTTRKTAADTKVEKLEAELALVKADLEIYKSYMHIVRQKARNDDAVGLPLFSVLRRYQKQLKEEANRV